MEKIKVLLVDDDVALGSTYSMGLKHLGFEVHYMSSFISVVGTINEFQPNIVILDIELGEKNGIIESGTIFNHFPDLPIIFISSHTEIEYIQQAIGQGGALYLKKPFDIEELGVYIKRFAKIGDEVHGLGDFRYTHESSQLCNIKTGETHKLSKREGTVLRLLIENMDNVIPRDDIERELWHDDNVSTNFMLNNIISRLRKFFSVDPSIQIISIPKVGYKLTLN